jgi:hypothetical protein
MIYDMVYIFNCNWVDTRWQQYSSHLHTNSTQNTPNRTYITITKLFHTYFEKLERKFVTSMSTTSVGI